MLSRVFIDRPIFAWVIAIVIMLGGLGGLTQLPVEQFPDIAPPQITVRANYPGASADVVENSVTQVIEQQLTGLDGLLYFEATSTARGQVRISATFDKGTDPDIAQVQVQNRIQQALPRLPQQVQQQGITVRKSNPDMLMMVTLFDRSDRMTNLDISDYTASYLQDPLSRIDGVGEVNTFGSPYAMRIWLDPTRLAAHQLMPGDVIGAIQAQNVEVAAGELGAQPMPETQMLSATVTAQARFSTPEQFRDIIVKSERSGAFVRLGDVARVELGSESYQTRGRLNRHPASGISISLAPGADALKTADLVKAEIAKRAKDFPDGLDYVFPVDSTKFIRISVNEVVKTLLEAVVLVVIVIFLFLQNWRATLIPAIAVPVVLLGTFGVFAIAGFSINTLTLFGLVLAIGLLVDDAIVVVENVQRLMEENPGMSPREATIRSMEEIRVALVAIALVLSAVFMPMAFFGGSTGVIYRQFSLTIIAAMVLSVVVALVLSPALTSTILHRPDDHGGKPEGRLDRIHARFNAGFERMLARYLAVVERILSNRRPALIVYVLTGVLLVLLFLRLPTSFLPSEDQGTLALQYTLPSGATQPRTLEVQKAVEHYFMTEEARNIEAVATFGGSRGGGIGSQNVGQGFVLLKDWSERSGAQNAADAIAARASRSLAVLRDAEFVALAPPVVRGLGQTAGFSLHLQNSGGLSRDAFRAARDQLLEAARADPLLASIRQGGLEDGASLQVEFDQATLQALGLDAADVNTTLSAAWGGRYVNDFIDRGRVKRVFVQGDAPYRSRPEDLGQWHVRASDGSMAPFDAFARTSWSRAPATLTRFSGFESYEIQGQAADGTSSGEAMDRIEALASELPGVSVAWSGASFQERLSTGQAPLLYALSLLVVFLCLAALYESWSIPVAVMLVVPLGLIGAVLAVTLRGLENDVFLQIGLLTTMGLAAKNAILMIEFAEQAERRGERILAAALEAARIRLRPILMTSLAFMFGVLPLAISTGAGANARVAIGTAVIGGMLSATVLAVFYIPLFFLLVRRGTRDFLGWLRARRGVRT